MNPSPQSELLTLRQRLWYSATGCSLLALLLIARCLSPNEYGMGTHQQLGLPPCTVVAMFGVPCPTCGMTTSWAHLTRGNLLAAWHCNPGGVSLALVALTVSAWSLSTAIRGTYRPWVSLRASTVAAGIIGLLTVVGWLGKIF